MNKRYILFKNSIDIVVGWILFIIVSPIVLVVLFMVSIESEGSPIYKDKRVGKDFKKFNLLKIRTMYINSPRGFTSENDNRVTKIGNILRKTSMDELLQFVNMIRGEMSLIGPRPDLISNAEKYDPIEMNRLLVKPGITGIAQVSGRNSIPWKERYKLDCWYVENLSMKVDLEIFLKSIKKVLKMEGINKI